MARESIDSELTVIQSSKYGSQMRAAIHDALFKIDRNEQQDYGNSYASLTTVTGTGTEGSQSMSNKIGNWKVDFIRQGDLVLTSVEITILSEITSSDGSATLKTLQPSEDIPGPYARGKTSTIGYFNCLNTGGIWFVGNSLNIDDDDDSVAITIDVSEEGTNTIPAGTYILQGFLYLEPRTI